jgi:hypothetical protein
MTIVPGEIVSPANLLNSFQLYDPLFQEIVGRPRRGFVARVYKSLARIVSLDSIRDGIPIQLCPNEIFG